MLGREQDGDPTFRRVIEPRSIGEMLSESLEVQILIQYAGVTTIERGRFEKIRKGYWDVREERMKRD